MKSILLISNAVLLFAAGRPAIPTNVMKEFSSKYPNVEVKKWTRADGNYYSAKFVSNKKTETAFFSLKGDWIKTETKIKSLNDLPVAVKESMKNRGFLGDNIVRMENRETPKTSMYVIDVNDANQWDADRVEIFAQSYRLYFDGNGDLVNKKLLE